jgi:DMSO/TMAO reductase YedYZ molybdopterin-dependent catalytic subunit
MIDALQLEQRFRMRDRTGNELPLNTSAPARQHEDVRLDALPTLGRREWLALGVTTAGALAARRLLGQAAGARSAPDSARAASDLVVRNARALDAEAPISALATFETSPEHFFVRSHFGPPTQLPLEWTLAIDGEVQRPVTLTLDEIRKMGAQTRPVTLECAGNGRGVFRLPKTSGVQWEYGAVSTATWTGVPLGALLERAGLTTEARHLWMEAADQAPGGAVPKFLRSIPREVALGDVFVAYAMNERPIPLLHGGPLRLIVPGWFGMASTKWLTHVHAMRAESDNYFMSRGYRYADGTPVTTMRPKSVIASPLAGQRVPAGMLTMRGQAWSGGAAIRAVDVSSDGGRTWGAARLVGTPQPGAWRTWEADVNVRSGPALLMARATDATGAAQPNQATPNPGGYANNSIHGVPIHVA